MAKTRSKVSLQEIADKFGVSKNAVSLALNNKPGVGEELRENILKAAQELNYQGLTKKNVNKSNNFLMLIPEYIKNDPNFYNGLYWAIENEAKLRGYNAILACVDKNMENELRLPNVYTELSIRGIMILGVFEMDYIRMVSGLNLPLVSVDSVYENFKIDAVGNANFESGYCMTSYLIEKGHRDICFVGPLNIRNFFERWNGFCKAMRDNHLKIDEGRCVCYDSSMTMQYRNCDEIEAYIAKMERLPSAFICGGDHIAVALLGVFTQRNIRVPEDVSIVGIDDIELSRMITPQLTTYAIDRPKIGYYAVEMLIQNMDNQGCGGKKLAVYGNLTERMSVADLNSEAFSLIQKQ
jgi:DNA-binding LacI/PurR family transcriptional regulator